MTTQTAPTVDPDQSSIENTVNPASETLRSFLRHRVAVVAGIVLVLLFLAAFVGAPLWHFRYNVPTDDNSGAPSLTHPLGTDNLGFDVLALVLHGTQRSLLIALCVALGATVVGAIWGAVAGYVGGIVDSLMMRAVDLVLIFPVLAVAAFLGHVAAGRSNSWQLIALVLAALAWPSIARVVRGVTLSLREQEFVQAARYTGAGPIHIVFRHILPNAAGVIIVSATVMISLAILSETALSYLGFGVQSPDTSLGLLIKQAEGAIMTRPWLFYSPGIVAVLISLCVGFLGDGLRDAFSPKGRAR